MIIETKFYGKIEVEDNRIINFKNGIPGFENLNSFALIDIENNTNLKFLQSLEKKDVCLIIVSPWDFFKDYEVYLSDDELKELEINNENDVLIFNVITVREKVITVNLVAPIIINVINKNAKQIILSESKYSIRQEISCL